MIDYVELLTLFIRYKAQEAREMKAWRKGGIAWKQHCATMRNYEKKLRRALDGK